MPLPSSSFMCGAGAGLALSAGLYYYISKSRSSNQILLLKDADVENLLSMGEAIEINAKAFCDLAQAKAVVPPRNIVEVKRHNGFTLFKPCYISSSNALGIKVVSTRPNNVDINLPTVPATITMFDTKSGMLDAILEATYLTALRTAAGSGAATRLLSDTCAKTLCIWGAGMQAKAHLNAMMEVRGDSLTTLHIINRNKERGEKLVRYAKEKYGNTLMSISLWHQHLPVTSEVVASADIICTTTNSSVPVFDGTALSNNTHINAVGSYTPKMQEIDEHTVTRCRIYIDTCHALESGDLKIPIDQSLVNEARHGIVEIGNALLSSSIVHKVDGIDCTLFKSVGTAVQDIATAAAVVAKAKRKTTIRYM